LEDKKDGKPVWGDGECPKKGRQRETMTIPFQVLNVAKRKSAKSKHMGKKEREGKEEVELKRGKGPRGRRGG